MKAFLLAAGKGERLRPLTENIPKCMVPIGGEPLLGIWLRALKKHGVSDVLINLHHLASEVEQYLRENSFGLRISTFYEERLLGTAGTVAANKNFVEGEDLFFIVYADNLTNVNLTEMMDFHLHHGGFFTIGLFLTERPRECGVVEMNEDNVVVSFTEKPKDLSSNLANAGIYISGPELFGYIPRKEFIDFGFDILPRLVRKMHGYIINDYLRDIGNLETYERAQHEWKAAVNGGFY